MFQKIRERLYKLKSRLYIEGQYLNDADFQIGQNIKYRINKRKQKVTVVLSDNKTSNKVAQTTVRSGKVVPVIDIKTKEIRDFFDTNSDIEVSIYKGRIIFTVKEEVSSKVIGFKRKSIAIPIKLMSKAVGWEQPSLFELFNLTTSETTSSNFEDIIEKKVGKTLRLLSLFSGIGSFEKALTRQNISYELVNYCEIDRYASKAYSLIHNISESLNLWDVRKVCKENINGNVDAMTWGFPCSDLSNAGLQKGFIDEDGNITRSGLYYEGIRILKMIKPKFSIIENVKALISKKFTNEYNMILSDLDKAGYNSYSFCYNAADFKIPQHRERIFIVSIRKDIDTHDFNLLPVANNTPVKLKDFLVNGEIANKYYLKDSVMAKFKEKLSINSKTNIVSVGQVSNDGSQSGKVYSIHGNFPTICACTHGYALGYIMIGKLIRRLIPVEVARLMGFDDSDIEKCQNANISDSQLYKMLGNSIVVDVLEYIFGKLFKDYKIDTFNFAR